VVFLSLQWRCNGPGTGFSPPLGFEKRRLSPANIDRAVSLTGLFAQSGPQDHEKPGLFHAIKEIVPRL